MSIIGSLNMSVAQSSTAHAAVSLSPRLPKRKAYLIFGIVSLALLMSSIDGTVVSVSLPTMVEELQTNLAWVAWTLTGYLLSQTIIMPVAGKLSDEFGRKRVFLAAVSLFTLSSLAAGLAPNIYLLIIFRVLQGAGGGAFMPTATGIISDTFGERRASAIGLFGSIFPIGGILGPNIGGLIIDHFSWRWIFFINVPLGIALVIVGWINLDRTKPTAGRSLDVQGAGLFGAMMLATLYALTTWADNPRRVGPVTWVFFAIGALLLALLVRHVRRVPSPIIEPDLLRRRAFIGVNIYNFVFGAVAFGFFSFMPYYASIAYGMTAGENGIILTPRSLAMIATSTLSSLFIIRFRYRLPMVIGLAIVAAGLFFLSRGYHDVSLFGFPVSNVVLLALMVMIGGFGIGIANPASNNAALDLIPEKVAAVAGLRGMFRSTGGVMGTAGFILALSQFEDKAVGIQTIFLVCGFMLLFLIPVIFLIPDSAHNRYVASHEHPVIGPPT